MPIYEYQCQSCGHEMEALQQSVIINIIDPEHAALRAVQSMTPSLRDTHHPRCRWTG